MQASLALASTELLLQRVPLLADDLPLLEAVAMLLKPSYALAGAGQSQASLALPQQALTRCGPLLILP